MLKIAVFDDHPVIPLSIEAILNKAQEKFTLIDVPNSRTLINLVNKKEIDILILDVNYPGEDTLQLLSHCFMVNADLNVLVFSSNLDVHYAKRYLQIGAKGYINKSASSKEIVDGIKTIIGGKKYFSVDLIEKFTEQALFNVPDNLFDSLSSREFEICKLMISGHGVSEIAETLSLKATTVATYKHRVYEKLSVNNLIELYQLYLVHFPDTITK
jgi:DNA-binding NarL/FixJ family response regulator